MKPSNIEIKLENASEDTKELIKLTMIYYLLKKRPRTTDRTTPAIATPIKTLKVDEPSKKVIAEEIAVTPSASIISPPI